MTVSGVPMSEAVKDLMMTRFGADDTVDGPPRILPEKHLELARALRDELGFKIFGFVVASHHPAPSAAKPPEGKSGESKKPSDTPVGVSGEDKSKQTVDLLRVVYGLRSVGKGTEIATWQIEVPWGESVPSLVESFAGADWQEREQFDLVGVKFARHPDLRRLMLPEDWKGHPLRKDYAIDTEVAPWR